MSKCGGNASRGCLPFPSVTFHDVLVTDQDGETAMNHRTVLHGRGTGALSQRRDTDLRHATGTAAGLGDHRRGRHAGLGGGGRNRRSTRAAFTVENMSVTEGRILVRHMAGGREHVLADINAELSARTLAGPWRASGDMTVDGVATRGGGPIPVPPSPAHRCGSGCGRNPRPIR